MTTPTIDDDLWQLIQPLLPPARHAGTATPAYPGDQCIVGNRR